MEGVLRITGLDNGFKVAIPATVMHQMEMGVASAEDDYNQFKKVLGLAYALRKRLDSQPGDRFELAYFLPGMEEKAVVCEYHGPTEALCWGRTRYLACLTWAPPCPKGSDVIDGPPPRILIIYDPYNVAFVTGSGHAIYVSRDSLRSHMELAELAMGAD